jgi:hypothetical protein
MNLDTGAIDLRLDGILVAPGIPMHPRPMTSIALSGWGRPRSASLDDLLAARIEQHGRQRNHRLPAGY